MPIEFTKRISLTKMQEPKKEARAEEGKNRDVYNPKSRIPYIEFFVDGVRMGGRHITREEEGEYLKRFYAKYKGRNVKVIVNDPAKPFGYSWYELV